MHFISCEQEFAMVDVKTEGKERETDDLKAKLQEEGKLLTHLLIRYTEVFTIAFWFLGCTLQDPISANNLWHFALDLFVF